MLLKLPESKETIQLVENGERYELDVTNIPAMRELAKLSETAMQAANGQFWKSGNEAGAVKNAVSVINTALGEDAYIRMCKELPHLEGNAVLLLGICGQLFRRAKEVVGQYVEGYKHDGAEGLKEAASAAREYVEAMTLIRRMNGGDKPDAGGKTTGRAGD